MNPAEDDTLEEMEALRSAGQSASWDSVGDSSNDFFLLSANLGAGHHHAAGAAGAGARQDINSLHSNLFKGYSIQSLEQQHHQQQRHVPSQPARSNNAADLASLLSRFESSSVADSLVSGAPLSTLNDYDEFDASSVLKMVDDLDEEDLEEVAAAKSAASAWGAPTRSADAYGIGVNQQQRIPQPSSSALPAPSTPAKIMSVEEIEAKLKGHAAASPSQPVATPTKDPALANLPEALHSLVLSGQTSQQSPSGYQGPPLPHFQHGSPAPQGLSVDENDRQHFYIPLPRSNHGLGFMTKSEIALVFRIQLSQLQSDDLNDPLKGDFYYQVMQARKGGKVNSSGQAILPVFKSGQQRNEDGSPKLPEGTLGRISAFSIHKPKKLMALGGGDDSTSVEDVNAQPRKTNMFAGRTLNYLIEEGYRCLMDLEDVDALLASLAPQRFEDPVRAYDRQRLVAQRADLCNRLLESLDLDEVHARMNEVAAGEHLIFKFYAIPKGRLLLYRSLVLLNPPLTYQLVDVLMHDLAQISMPAVPASSTDEKLVLLISDLIYSMPLLPYANEIFSYFLTPKHAPRLLELIRTHMLCSFLQVLFKKGHEALMILQQNPHVPPGMPGMPGIRETVQQWRGIFDGICNSLRGNVSKLFEGLPKDAKPTLPPTQSQIAARNRREKEKEKAAAASADKKGDEKKAAEEKKTAEEEKKEKDATPAAPSYLSTRFGMWELMAAFFSHASPDQHAWLNVELKDVLLKEFEMLYGEYKERKEKQAAAAAAAEKEKEAAAASEAAKEKTEESDKEKSSTVAGSPSAPRPARNPNPVPPAASLPPPPSPALRFLSSALLGDQNPDFQQISKVWNDLHNDYMYYQHKHQQKVQQEQNRLAQLQQMRQSRQLQQQRQWQQYQNQRQHGNVGQSPNRPHVPPQHQHFHQSPQGGFQQQQQQHYQQQQQGPRGNYHQGGYNNNNQQRQQRYNNQQPYQQSPPQSNEPPKPVPVWVKGGTSGANAVKGAPGKSPAK